MYICVSVLVRECQGDALTVLIQCGRDLSAVVVEVFRSSVAVDSSEPKDDTGRLVERLQNDHDVLMGVCHVPVVASLSEVVGLFKEASYSLDHCDGRIEQPHEDGCDSQSFKGGPYADGACDHLVEEVNLVEWDEGHLKNSLNLGSDLRTWGSSTDDISLVQRLCLRDG